MGTSRGERERLDRAYERGVKDGKESDIIDDLGQTFIAPLISIPDTHGKADEVYRKGYKWGAEHRYDDEYGEDC